MSYTVCLFVVLIGFTLMIAVDCYQNWLNENESFWNGHEKSKWKWHGTKTRYEDAFKIWNQSLSTDLNQDYYQIMSKCEPKSVILISRHATRLPDYKLIVDMSNDLYKLRDQLLANQTKLKQIGFDQNDLDELAQWKLTMNPKRGKRIVNYGRWETRALSNRFTNRYLNLLNPKHSNLSVGITFKIRTRETAQAFFEQIQHKYPELKFNPIVKQSLISHRECKKHLKNQGVKLSNPKIFTKFLESDTYQNFLIDFNQLVHTNDTRVQDSKYLSFKLKLIYSICVYERAILGKSIWCNLFSSKQFQLIEYANDLKIYYSGAYGLNVNHRLTCDLLKEIFNIFRQIQSNPQRKIIRLNFTHAGLLKRLYTMFGIASKFASSHCRTNQHSCTDEWRTSFLLPFLANLEFTLYHCAHTRPEWMVMTRLQEHPVKLNGCDHVHCPLDQFLDFYTSLIENCSIKNICKL